MEIVIDDPRLRPILEKVEAGQRLSYDDGVTLYRTSDILAVGYMANLVRERLHGSTTYFNVNRHINPTDVSWPVAVCARSASAPRTPRPTPCRSRRCGIAPAKAGARPSPSSTSWAGCIRS